MRSVTEASRGMSRMAEQLRMKKVETLFILAIAPTASTTSVDAVFNSRPPWIFFLLTNKKTPELERL